MLTNFVEPLATALSQFGWRDALDIIIMTVIVYAAVKILSRTRAMRVVLGLGIILVFVWIAQLLDLATVQWVFSWLLQASAVFIVILFQPELRRALEKLGRGRIFDFTNIRKPNAEGEELVEQFTTALEEMAQNRVGAIIVFERKTGLADIVETGTIVDADVTASLIETIFYPNNPLHDGAMIIKDGRIWAAGCFLPLSDNKQIGAEFGSRHRASLGISEVSDAYVLVVSEERGEVSFIYDGSLSSGISEDRIRTILKRLYMPDNHGYNADRDVDLSADTKEIPTQEILEAQRVADEANEAASDAQQEADEAEQRAQVAESAAEEADYEAGRRETERRQ